MILAGLVLGNLGLFAASMGAVIAGLVWAQPRFELGRALAMQGRGDLANAELTARRVAATELVPMLLDVAADRLPECRIEQAHPRLARWLASVLAR